MMSEGFSVCGFIDWAADVDPVLCRIEHSVCFSNIQSVSDSQCVCDDIVDRQLAELRDAVELVQRVICVMSGYDCLMVWPYYRYARVCA